MPRKQPLSLEQHRQLGLELEAARLLVMRAYIHLGNAYPIAFQGVNLAKKAQDAISDLKCALDDAAVAQLPDDAAPTTIYYGRSEEAEIAISAIVKAAA